MSVSTGTIPRQIRFVIVSCLAALTALSWVYLIRLDRQMAAAMDYEQAMAAMGMSMRGPWAAADVWMTALMWLVMMIGMMAPSAAPVLLLYASSAAAREPSRVSLPTLAFGSGYLLVWASFSASAALVQWWLHEAALLSSAMRTSSGVLGGVLIVAAGLYQWTPIKTACLSYCRSPMGYLITNWHNGLGGAFLMGSRHGMHCLGCCWALMLILFAVGVMNLVWVAVLAVLVFVEKLGPAGVTVSRAASVVLVGLGVAMMFGAM